MPTSRALLTAVATLTVAAITLAAAPDATTKPRVPFKPPVARPAKPAVDANANAPAVAPPPPPPKAPGKVVKPKRPRPTTRPTPHDPEVPNDFALDYAYLARAGDVKALRTRMDYVGDATCEQLAGYIAEHDISLVSILDAAEDLFGAEGRDRVSGFVGDLSTEDLGTPTINNLNARLSSYDFPYDAVIFINNQWKLDVHSIHSKLEGNAVVPYQKGLKWKTERNIRIARDIRDKRFGNLDHLLENIAASR